ncbi:MAG: hypothetical protein WA775_02895 [Psychroserpens sp.]|uniref:hypothetical protein n=1 Tax=Psychroserpens sp. TaxID=2020870 RepID=UPI003CB1BD0D
MNPDIQPIADDKILVNDKLVYLNQDGNWIAKIELTNNETEALNNHLNAPKSNDTH